MVTTCGSYPFEKNFLTIDTHQYHYVDEGQGDALLMVHGNPTWSYYYRYLIKHFRKQYRVIAPDHIGCGLSDKPNDGNYSYTLEQRIQDLETLVARLKLNNITLVVHDWGGMIGMGFATRHPELIKRIVLFNTAAFPNPKGQKLPWSIAACRAPFIGPLLVRGFNAFCLGAIKTCFTRRDVPSEEKSYYLKPYNNWSNRRAVARFVQDIPLTDKDPSWLTLMSVEEKLRLFNKTPMLILWGSKDFVFDQAFLSQWQGYFPHAEVHRLNQVGHYIADDAYEDVIPIMEQFLDKE